LFTNLLTSTTNEILTTDNYEQTQLKENKTKATVRSPAIASNISLTFVSLLQSAALNTAQYYRRQSCVFIISASAFKIRE